MDIESCRRFMKKESKKESLCVINEFVIKFLKISFNINNVLR